MPIGYSPLILLCLFERSFKPDRSDIHRIVKSVLFAFLNYALLWTAIGICVEELNEDPVRNLNIPLRLFAHNLNHNNVRVIHVSVIDHVSASNKRLASVGEKLISLFLNCHLYQPFLIFEIIFNQGLEQLITVYPSDKTSCVIVSGDICRILGKKIAYDLTGGIVALLTQRIINGF